MNRLQSRHAEKKHVNLCIFEFGLNPDKHDSLAMIKRHFWDFRKNVYVIRTRHHADKANAVRKELWSDIDQERVLEFDSPTVFQRDLIEYFDRLEYEIHKESKRPEH